MASEKSTSLGLLLARLPLGLYFLLAGVGKIINVGVKNFVSEHLGLAKDIMPEALARAYLYAVPFAEVLVGLLVVIGFYTRPVAAVMALMLISFTIGTTGIAWNLGGGPPFNSNLILLGMALLLALVGPGRYSIDGKVGGGRSRGALAKKSD